MKNLSDEQGWRKKAFQSRRTACTKVPSYDADSTGIFRELESMKGKVVKVRLERRQDLDQGG